MANDHGYAAIKIEEIGLYVRDTYDFLNAGDDQLLGYWSKNGVLRTRDRRLLLRQAELHRRG
ncbi:DUF6402 family protein [Azotobacter chroococcum]|nr:DUF6402 family protein [Azotobacter chroococcum]